MKTILLAIVASAAVIGGTGAAFAQERAPFTGPYVAAIAGGDRVQGGGDHDDGFLYGVAGGWDFALGRSVRAGVELEATDSSQKDCTSGAIRAGDELCVRTGRDLYAGVRLGTLLGERTMAYAKAGYTNARATARYDSGLPTGSTRDAANADGFRLGAGVEHMLGDHAFARAEYRYSNYEAGGERHQLVAGLGVRF